MPRKSLDDKYLPAEKAKRVKDEEYDDKGDVRINSLFMSGRELRAMRRELAKANPEGAKLLYSKRAGGALRYGGEDIVDLLPRDDYQQLVQGRAARHHISADEADAQLRAGLQGQGHVGIAAEFTADGRAVEAPSRQSGEVHLFKEKAVANDKSGRYMSAGVRPNATYEQLDRALTNVSRDMSRELGIPVEPKMIKNSGRAPANPVSGVAAGRSVNAPANASAKATDPAAAPAKKAKKASERRR